MIALIRDVRFSPLVLEVTPSLQVTAVPELIAYAKANPGKLNIASGGNGSAGRLARRFRQADGR